MRKPVNYIVGKLFKPLVTRWLSVTRTYVYKDILLRIPPGVFHPGLFFSTRLLLKYISRQPIRNHTFLELGAGSGLISFYAEKSGALVTATDINPGVIINLHINSRLNGCSPEIIHSDLFQAIPERAFDIIVVNPPYYKKDPRDDAGYAWYCGANGEFFAGLFCGLERFTHNRSSVWMVLSDGCDIEMIKGFADKHGWIARCVQTKRNLLEKNFIYTFARDFYQITPDAAYGNKNILPLVGP
ncbi:methyltransferase [Flavitalea flava]